MNAQLRELVEAAGAIRLGYENGLAVIHGAARLQAAVDAIAALAAPKEAGFDMLAHLQRQREWSERIFGPGARTAGVVDHIRKELREIEADPTDLMEWIDVVILALDGAWRCGGTPEQIIGTIVAKQTKNEGRNWPDWRTAAPDKAIEHDRTKDANPPVDQQQEGCKHLWSVPDASGARECLYCGALNAPAPSAAPPPEAAVLPSNENDAVIQRLQYFVDRISYHEEYGEKLDFKVPGEALDLLLRYRAGVPAVDGEAVAGWGHYHASSGRWGNWIFSTREMAENHDHKGYSVRALFTHPAGRDAKDGELRELAKKWRVTQHVIGQGSAGNKARIQCSYELLAALNQEPPK